MEKKVNNIKRVAHLNSSTSPVVDVAHNFNTANCA